METGGMVNEVVNGDKWLTLREASKLTGKSVNALRLMISRHRLTRVKKARDNNGTYWMIHRDEVNQACLDQTSPDQTCQSGSGQDMAGVMIPLMYHDIQRKEWMQERDQLSQGLMMYRYKYEELERQVKLLPAPVEVVSSKLEEQERTIAVLQAELEQARRPWWKRLWK